MDVTLPNIIGCLSIALQADDTLDFLDDHLKIEAEFRLYEVRLYYAVINAHSLQMLQPINNLSI